MGRAALAVLLLLLAGCARPGERAVERAIRSQLPALLGPAARYETRVRADSLGAIQRGRLRRVSIDGESVALSKDLTFSCFSIEAREIEMDVRQRSLKRVGEARFTARLSAADLTRFVRARRRGLEDAVLSVDRGLLMVSVRPRVLGYPTVPVRVAGTLVPRGDGRALDFVPDSAHLSVVPVPGVVLDFLAERLNPAVDLSGLPVALFVASVRLDGDVLVLAGSIPPASVLALIAAGRR